MNPLNLTLYDYAYQYQNQIKQYHITLASKIHRKELWDIYQWVFGGFFHHNFDVKSELKYDYLISKYQSTEACD